MMVNRCITMYALPCSMYVCNHLPPRPVSWRSCSRNLIILRHKGSLSKGDFRHDSDKEDQIQARTTIKIW